MSNSKTCTKAFPAVDVMIPVYKVEPFISRCLRSVLEQDYPNLRVVLVNDASPDSSMAMAEEIILAENRYAHKVEIHHRSENGGLGQVRHDMYGLLEGKYVLFIDSDDFLDNDKIVSEWVAVAEEGHFDVVLSDYCFDYCDSQKIIRVTPEKSGRDIAFAILLGEREGYYWNKLFRVDKLFLYRHLHQKGRNFWEDLCIMVPFMYRAEHIGYYSSLTLHYVQFNTDAYTSSFNPKYIESLKGVLDAIGDELMPYLTKSKMTSSPSLYDPELDKMLRKAYVRIKWLMYAQLPLRYYTKVRAIRPDCDRYLATMPMRCFIKLLYRLCSHTWSAPLARPAILLIRKLQTARK